MRSISIHKIPRSVCLGKSHKKVPILQYCLQRKDCKPILHMIYGHCDDKTMLFAEQRAESGDSCIPLLPFTAAKPQAQKNLVLHQCLKKLNLEAWKTHRNQSKESDINKHHECLCKFQSVLPLYKFSNCIANKSRNTKKREKTKLDHFGMRFDPALSNAVRSSAWRREPATADWI